MRTDTMNRFSLALVMLTGFSVATTGCIEDPDCGICDPDNLILESISGVNYSNKKVHVLNPTCEGEDCPNPIKEGRYFIDRIGECEETEEALASPRGPEEYCRPAPLVTVFGLEFVFNNLLDATSIENVRKNPGNPQLFEVYDWKSQILSLKGATTRFNGDYFVGTGDNPDSITRAVNLSCIDNLADQNVDFDHTSDPTACHALSTVTTEGEETAGSRSGFPLKMRFNETLRSYRGETTWLSQSCSPPPEGPDTCCTVCDYQLAVNVARYGVDGSGEWLNANANLGHSSDPVALECDPTLDKYTQCRTFTPFVDRSDEKPRHEYYWSCDPADPACKRDEAHPVPYFDRLRETHPDDRPEWLERRTVPCAATQDCTGENAANLPGTECVGEADADGSACTPGLEGCSATGHCVAEWFVDCTADAETTGPQGFCVDSRAALPPATTGTAGCLTFDGTIVVTDPDTGREQTVNSSHTQRLAIADADANGIVTAIEACQAGVGVDGEFCDPLYLDTVVPIDRFDRDKNLPEEAKGCVCEEGDRGAGEPSCARLVDRLCREDGDKAKPIKADREGQYAQKFVSKVGGVIYDPAIKGFEWRAAHIGNVSRARIENCAENRGLIGERNVEDGWRANDAFVPHSFEDYDRAMCSGTTYTVVFNQPSDSTDEAGAEYLQDKVENSMEGRNVYEFATPDYHVIPGSGFPTDNLRVGACDEFSLKFSNKYDMSAENLSKLTIIKVEKFPDPNDPTATVFDPVTASGSRCPVQDWLAGSCEFDVIAGGVECANTRAEAEATGLPPCLIVDVANQLLGEVAVEVDPVEFGAVLKEGNSYRMFVPFVSGVADDGSLASIPAEEYANAFWDICGMPVVGGDTDEQLRELEYNFTIDPPKCKEDKDQDGVPLSCDNADDFYNPAQEDIDADGFGDVNDLCVTVASSGNRADSDNDGIGNDCDTCRQTLKQYNKDPDDLLIPPTLWVRNVPFQEDFDQDGIGDVCDNCVKTANCESYGPDSPYVLGDPIKYDDANVCQRDDNADMIGDACRPAAPDDFDPAVAAGPVGFGDTDDFDQDGLPNIDDFCPRQPVERVTCASDADCGANALCETSVGLCNHQDSDDDQVGDFCDTCPFVGNRQQVLDGGMQDDDEDEDFVGGICETAGDCYKRTDPRPYSFYPVAASGQCCTTLLVERDGLLFRRGREDEGEHLVDPDGVPVTTACTDDEDEAGEVCRKLPQIYTLGTDSGGLSGILELPPGCDAALADAGLDVDTNTKIDAKDDLGGDLVALWDNICFLPQWDQDYDGLGDRCDLCPQDYDPRNEPYRNEAGKVFPDAGKYCNGDYNIENKCGGDDDGGDTGGTDGGSDGGSDGGGSDGGTGG